MFTSNVNNPSVVLILKIQGGSTLPCSSPKLPQSQASRATGRGEAEAPSWAPWMPCDPPPPHQDMALLCPRPSPVLARPPVHGFPSGSAGKESACNAGDLGSIPGLGKIPWRRERLPTLVSWPGELHTLYSPWGRKASVTAERPSLHCNFYSPQRSEGDPWRPPEIFLSEPGPGLVPPTPPLSPKPHMCMHTTAFRRDVLIVSSPPMRKGTWCRKGRAGGGRGTSPAPAPRPLHHGAHPAASPVTRGKPGSSRAGARLPEPSLLGPGPNRGQPCLSPTPACPGPPPTVCSPPATVPCTLPSSPHLPSAPR